MVDLATFAQPTAPDERVVTTAELAVLRQEPVVIDGVFWLTRPIWPILTTSGALLAFGVASVVQEVLR